MRYITILYAFLMSALLVSPAWDADAPVADSTDLTAVFLAFILALSIFLGFELISKVPATLHTPLMSGSNAISGITLVGAMLVAGVTDNMFSTFLASAAVAFAMANVVGGYVVTDRMLEMFKKKESKEQ